jgi:ribonuclease HIII
MPELRTVFMKHIPQVSQELTLKMPLGSEVSVKQI